MNEKIEKLCHKRCQGSCAERAGIELDVLIAKVCPKCRFYKRAYARVLKRQLKQAM